MALPLIATHQVDWTGDTGGTGSSNTGPTANGGAYHTLGTSLGCYFYCETSCSGTGYPSREFDLVSPYMDFTALTALSNLLLASSIWYDTRDASTRCYTRFIWNLSK